MPAPIPTRKIPTAFIYFCPCLTKKNWDVIITVVKSRFMERLDAGFNWVGFPRKKKFSLWPRPMLIFILVGCDKGTSLVKFAENVFFSSLLFIFLVCTLSLKYVVPVALWHLPCFYFPCKSRTKTFILFALSHSRTVYTRPIHLHLITGSEKNLRSS